MLKAPDVPSVLVELGYMSTKDDLKQLTSAAWQARTAAALAQAIDTFFAPRLAGAAAEAIEMGYWPQFQHKTEPFQRLAAMLGKSFAGHGLAVKNLSVLWVTGSAGKARGRVRGGTIRA